MKAVEGGAVESSFQVTPEWLTTVFHTCKIHPILSERGAGGAKRGVDSGDNDLLQKLLDWRPVEQAVQQYNEANGQSTNDTDFFTRTAARAR